jgi:enoyl-CoA hydratase
MSEVVIVEKKSGYALLTLNRPEAKNALSRELRAAFVAAFEDFQNDDSINVVIVTGNGNAFCAGFDLKELADSQGNAAEEADNAMARAIAAFDGPIIAAVNGYAITGGFELVLACDVIVASSEARFADTHARVGILPGWGLSQKLPRMIGLSRAKQISLTGNTIDAQRACEWGLVNEVLAPADLLPHCEQLAQDMNSCVMPVLKQYKQMIEDGFSMPLVDALEFEETKAIESAKLASAAMITARKDKVIARGRDQGKD